MTKGDFVNIPYLAVKGRITEVLSVDGAGTQWFRVLLTSGDEKELAEPTLRLLPRKS